ncbi:unnamed protein product [Symbiodinium natans]|uniref:Uncharacterized protein n=1 Tax=Symbiodinium natans TaxID=878477 RepID=A0A812TTE0_9DINO|nr:unnamed protein product [Symbiodinium natans]
MVAELLRVSRRRTCQPHRSSRRTAKEQSALDDFMASSVRVSRKMYTHDLRYMVCSVGHRLTHLFVTSPPAAIAAPPRLALGRQLAHPSRMLRPVSSSRSSC